MRVELFHLMYECPWCIGEQFYRWKSREDCTSNCPSCDTELEAVETLESITVDHTELVKAMGEQIT